MMDRELVTRVIGLLKDSTALELAVREGESYVRVRRLPEPPPAPVPAAAVQAGDAGAGAPPGQQPPLSAEGLADVRARLVGRFHHGKGPGQPPLARIGDQVEEGQTIGVIEALGKMTTVSAPAPGVLVEFIAADGSPVQYGAVLMRLQQAQE